MTLKLTVLEPTHPEAKKLTKDDVWGKWSEDYTTKIHSGMIVADHNFGGHNERTACSKKKCPIFGDHVPYKSVTVVGPKALSEEIAYWLEYVHGSDCIQEVRDLEGDKVAFRSGYQAW